MTNQNYPHETWNNWAKYEFRTNNASEAFNSKLRKYDLPKDPNIFRLVEVLQDIDLEYFATVRQICLG